MTLRRVLLLLTLSLAHISSTTCFVIRFHGATTNNAAVVLQSASNDSNGSVDYLRDAAWQKRSTQWLVLVDDEESIRRAVGKMLYDSGYQVTACANGEAALPVILGGRPDDPSRLPDVIVSDIRMPGGMDGLELLRRIRENDKLVAIPVVLLTAKGQTQDRIAGYEASCDAYLTKPFDPEELLAIVDTVVERRIELDSSSVDLAELQDDLREIKSLLAKGGAGVGHGWVDANNLVFFAPDERNVLELLCEGLKNREIAEKTFLSTRRVEQLITILFRKTGVKNRTELVRWAISTGNVDI